MFKIAKDNWLRILGIFGALYIGHGFYVNSEQYQLDRIYDMTVDHVVEVTTESGNSGGTGFYVITPKGKSYILTNAHVCGVKNEQNQVFIRSSKSSRRVPHRIIEESGFTDLCLIENSESHEGGIKLSDNWIEKDARPNKLLYVLGHPSLFPSTLTRGTIIDKIKVRILDHYSWEDCDKPKNKKVVINFGFFGEIKACMMEILSYRTTIVGLPGNSGSPAVNTSGRLVGVLFAGDSRANWSILVAIEDIREFLKPY